MFEKAIIIAVSAHQGQVDKGGNPYILHPLAVMLSLEDEIERICAVLHNVIEDTDITLEYLKNEGFSNQVLTALDTLSRRKDESYDEFIDRIINNKIACHVKLADLKHNMDLSRIKQPSQKDYDRIKKYQKAVKALSKK
ncbi:GTP pyrophosphokinase [uncultured Clostridium sp.]|uniref:GTP pyrophosphokinase n=1 Tax=uncultured Clostridium sp. TaxID=59620 RepID=UPI0028E42834|nr:GTP pyrophosphokinase [uncultured Clostridium sp.]